MKNIAIKKIEVTLFEITVPDIAADPSGFGVWYRRGAGTPQQRFAIRIYADDGTIGEYVPPRSRAPVVMAASIALAHLLIGKPALERERHYQTMRNATKHVGDSGIGALDIALWDLAGKVSEQPIAQLLGGHRWVLPAYASTIPGDEQPDGLSNATAYADFAERCLELGYRGYKMHGWKEGTATRESQMIQAVGERVGGRMDIMYDGACHLKTLADAVRIGHTCDDYGLMWLEDPYNDGGLTIRGHRALKAQIRTPIMIGEMVRNPEQHTELVAAGVTDFGRVDPDYDGGITGCYKAALATEAMGLDVEVHSCGPAMRHLMAALGRSNYYEVNLVHPRASNPWHLPVYADNYSDELDCIDNDGCVSVPQGPGLGITYDWDLINRHTIDSKRIE